MRGHMENVYVMTMESSDGKTRERSISNHAVFFLLVTERDNRFFFYGMPQASYSI